MRSFRPLALSVLLVLTLTSAAQARPLAPGDLFQSFWSTLVRLWAPTTPATKAGCILDPLGRCNTATAPTEEGCIIDPLGCSAAAAPVDEGCILDPLGGCSAGR